MKSITLKPKEIKALQADGKVTISRAIKRLKLHSDYGEPNWDRAWIDNSYDPPCLKVEYSGLCRGIPDPTIHRHWSPYKPGDRLWARETWATFKFLDNKKPSEIHQGIPQPMIWYIADDDNWDTRNPSAAPSNCMGKIRPSIFMPRWASRFDVEVKTVSVKDLDWVIEFKRIEK